ncbi:dissimilatory-type sulfite reductase subunit alpha [Pyrobaculum sp.]|uniref:dissimilatory-type sulfite reductase subunit alpha n=2 Tax=Pyrobaculum sp. TaxID=2004705 RepID=UPI00317843AB
MSAPANLPPKEELLNRAEEILKQLEGGPWPSHVSELRKTRYPLHVYGVGLVARKSPWGPAAVKVEFLNTGVLSRWARDWIPGGGSEVHFRVFHTPGKFLRTDFLRKITKISRELGVGLIELVGQTGALVLNLTPETAEAMVDALREIGTDVGGSGDAIRALNACVGPALCEFALYDTLKWYAEFHKDKRVNDNIVTPSYPYKFKIKFSGCPLDCARAQRGDIGFIGVWEGAPEVDQEAFRRKVEAGEVDPEKLAANCPSGAITWDNERKELRIDGTRCKKSMHCIRTAFPAIKPGKKRKVAVVVGGGSKGRFGPKLGWFIGYLEPDQVKDAIDLTFKVIGPWEAEAQPKYRLGDYIMHVGLDKFIEKAGIKLEGMPVSTAKMPDEVPYAVMPKEVRERFLSFAQQLKGRV